MGQFSRFKAGTWNGVVYSVDTVSNFTLSNFIFNTTTKTITFNISGPSTADDCCRVDIPKALMWCSNNNPWTVTIDHVPFYPIVINDTSYTYIPFWERVVTATPYPVQIQSTNALTEFQPTMLLPLLMILTLLAAMFIKRKRNLKK